VAGEASAGLLRKHPELADNEARISEQEANTFESEAEPTHPLGARRVGRLPSTTRALGIHAKGRRARSS